MVLIILVAILLTGVFGKASVNDDSPIRHYAHYDESIPCSLHVIEVDLTADEVSIQSTLPVTDGHQVLYGLQPLSGMAEHFETSSAGINADFFSFETSYPVNLHVSDYVPVTTPHRRSVFGITNTDSLFISQVDWDASITSDNTETLDIEHVNALQATGSPTLYTSHFNTPIHTDSTGKALAFTNDSGNFRPDKPRWLEGEIETSRYDLLVAIPEQNIQPESAKLEIRLPPVSKPVSEAVGGGPALISNGNIIVDEAAEQEGIGRNFVETRHPRTAIGFNSDQTKLYMVVADGRSDESDGMSLNELADFMLSIGADHAVNLDGGGSTTMLWDGNVINQPSDGSERAIANGLLIHIDE